MAGGLIGKAAKLVKGKSRSYTKKKPNKATRKARNTRKNIKKANDAEDRYWAGSPNPTKPSTQSKKKRAKAKAKSRYNQELRKEDRYERDKYGRSNIPF
jgi:hypothetical protein